MADKKSATKGKPVRKRRPERPANRAKRKASDGALAEIRIPKSKMRGHLGANWRGGRKMYCAVPDCGEPCGWKYPNELRRNKTGFRCEKHRHVKLTPPSA